MMKCRRCCYGDRVNGIVWCADVVVFDEVNLVVDTEEAVYLKGGRIEGEQMSIGACDVL